MTRTETLTIDGMTCEHCVRTVREALEGIDGVEVEGVRVGEALVRIDDGRASRDGLAAAIEEEGYTLVASASGDAPATRRLDAAVRRERAALLAFVRSKMDDPDLAEDIVQDSLLRAVRAAPDLRDDERMTAWLYQIVRHAVVDAYRRRGVRAGREERLGPGADVAAEPEDEARACACLIALVPALTPAYAEVVRADLAGNGDLAEALGITRNALKVRRHRAHRQLRARLEQTCRSCAAHGCVDCTCAAPGGGGVTGRAAAASLRAEPSALPHDDPAARRARPPAPAVRFQYV